MTFLTDLSEVLQNSNNALAGVFLRNHAKEIIALVEAAECIRHWHDSGNDGMVVSAEHVHKLWEALAALKKNPPKEIDPNKWAFDRGLESY